MALGFKFGDSELVEISAETWADIMPRLTKVTILTKATKGKTLQKEGVKVARLGSEGSLLLYLIPLVTL